MTSAEFMHHRIVKGLRQLIATGRPQDKSNAVKRLAEVLTVGRERGWND